MVGHVVGEHARPSSKAIPMSKYRPSHQEYIALAGFIRYAWLVQIHRPVKLADAMRIPGVSVASDREWTHLWGKGPWYVATVLDNAGTTLEGRPHGRTCHDERAMRWCCIGHERLPKPQCTFKGRAMLRGERIRDGTCHLAVLSEQGAAAHPMVASNMGAAISRNRCMAGQVVDAWGAYTQSSLSGVATWIEVPPHV